MAAYYNEIDDYAAQWLRNLIAAGHLPPGDVDTRPIQDVHPEDLAAYDQCHFFAGIGIWGAALRRLGLPDDYRIWTGSCPCQPFSAAGRGVGFADERHLWPAWFHLITQCRPSRIVGEQVASKDGLGWFDLVSTDLENAGYAVGAADLCAAGFSEKGRDGGGFHLRQRLYFVGLADADGRERAGRAAAPGRDDGNRPDPGRPQSNGCVTGGFDAYGLDDSASARRPHAGAGPPSEPERGRGRLELGCDGDGLADAGSGKQRVDGRAGGGLRFVTGGSEVFSGLDDASNERRGKTRGGRDAAGERLGGAGQSCGMADGIGAGLQGFGRDGRNGNESRRDDALALGPIAPQSHGGGLADNGGGGRKMAIFERGNSGPPESAGRADIARSGGSFCDNTGRLDRVSDYGPRGPNANIVYCRDEKWRPIEPGSLPLAYALPRSVAAMRPELRFLCDVAGFDGRELKAAKAYRAGALRGFGNALDLETVVGFLEAALPLAP